MYLSLYTVRCFSYWHLCPMHFILVFLQCWLALMCSVDHDHLVKLVLAVTAYCSTGCCELAVAVAPPLSMYYCCLSVPILTMLAMLDCWLGHCDHMVHLFIVIFFGFCCCCHLHPQLEFRTSSWTLSNGF